MLPDILNAIILECQAFKFGDGGTFLLKTDFKVGPEMPSYTMPLVLLELVDAEESASLVGGAAEMRWRFKMNSYCWEPNAYGDEAISGYSESLLQVIDDVRVHFMAGIWFTAGMTSLETNYGFRMTLSGIHPADALPADGLKLGFGIMFDSIGMDQSSQGWQDSTTPLQTTKQVNNPPFS